MRRSERSESGRRVDARIACDVLNRMTGIGRPESVAIGPLESRGMGQPHRSVIHAPTPRPASPLGGEDPDDDLTWLQQHFDTYRLVSIKDKKMRAVEYF
jgi:hypothetical protein